MVEFDEKTARRAFNGLALIFILYNVAFGVVYNIANTGVAAYLIGKNPSIDLAELESFLYNTGFALIAASTLSVLLAFLCSRKKPSFERNKKIDIKTVIILFAIIQGLQLICSLLLVPIEGLFYQAGYNFDEAVSLASDPSVYFSTLIYSVVAAPITEELIFRGLFMKKLQPYGKTFAMVVSALLFALMHQNIVQLPVTFVMGILFGYIAMEYSLGASILLHFLNNAFVEATGQLRNIYPYAGVFDSLFTYACTAAAIAIIVLNFKKIKEFVQREKAGEGVVRFFFTRPLVAVVIVYYFIRTLMSVSAI